MLQYGSLWSGSSQKPSWNSLLLDTWLLSGGLSSLCPFSASEENAGCYQHVVGRGPGMWERCWLLSHLLRLADWAEGAELGVSPRSCPHLRGAHTPLGQCPDGPCSLSPVAGLQRGSWTGQGEGKCQIGRRPLGRVETDPAHSADTAGPSHQYTCFR